MRAIVITGTTRGIGTALARHFLTEGRLVTGIDVGLPAAELNRAPSDQERFDRDANYRKSLGVAA
jgi:NAD(P)-dependent dehydrogenase (short-subunit alcohol dehydrogenase family)